jgi:hypothetical protein
MKCRVIKPFNRRGELQLPGSILDVPDEMIARLEGLVQLVVDSSAGSYSPDDWKPPFRAWLEGDGLRTTGVCDDLAIEIVKLTSDNLPLQAKLLRLHVGTYSGPYWLSMVRRWTERARVLFEAEGLGLHEARWRAAEEMNLLAFADELLLKQPA